MRASIGAGWWPAGLERLLNPDGILRWTSGDGATRRYVSVGANRWVAPALDRPDTIVLVGTSYFERRLANGARVRFDCASGRHTSTVNRLGHITRFVYSGGSTQVDSIVPPSGALGVGWAFTYDGSGRLAKVDASSVAVAQRRDTLTMDGTGRLVQIRQRDNATVQFGYSATELRRLVSRTDQRGVTDSVAYGPASRMSTVGVATSLVTSARDTLTLNPAETRGLAGTAAVPLDRASTVIDGFRRSVGDTTAYLVNRWGAPSRVRTALGDETHLTRGSATFPALVTELRSPNGRALVGTYDARGNVMTVLDSATVKAGPVYALTQYTWDQRWDVLLKSVGPEGDSSKSGLDAANGNVLWREDGRGAATRTNFTYDATTGLLIRALSATGVTDTIIYEPALRNASRRDQVLGQYTTWTQDGAGRVYRTERPSKVGVALVDSVVFDAMDRPTLAITRADADTLIVTQTYTAAGQLQRLVKRSAFDSTRAKVGAIATAYVYDGRNRVVAESLPAFYALAYTYDEAGNVTAGGRNPWATTYDALNRPVTKSGTDMSTFVYDEASNLRVAFNPVARVTRTYGQNGTLRTDSLRIATRRLEYRDFSRNVFGIGARYDLNSRRVAFQHPQTVAPAADSQRTWFNPASGLVDSVADILGNRFTFAYDSDARVVRTVRLSQSASAMAETLSYDVVGRLKTRVQRAGATVLHRDTLTYDLSDRIIGVAGANDGAGYNALGPLDTIWYGASGQESYKSDALGLRYAGFGSASLTGTAAYNYLAGSERLQHMVVLSLQPVQVSNDSTLYFFTSYGARGDEIRRKWFFAPGSCNPFCPPAFNMREVRTNSTAYDASWRVRSVLYRLDTIPAPSSAYRQYQREETYRYDPLGRRVWKQMIRDTANFVCANHDKSSGCRNEVTRTVWDGANILYDVRMNADTGLANGGEGYPVFGPWSGSVGYTSVGGVDAPVSVFKNGTVMVPYTNWRGTYDVGTCPTALCTPTEAFFPLAQATAFDDAPPPANGPPSWFGEVIGGQTDGSGYQYKRNRYYDARSGQFTQADPIGLAGGLNSYRFGKGDPINFDDPFGLCPEAMRKDANECAKWNTDQVTKAKELIDDERTKRNPHALGPVVDEDITGFNADQMSSVCDSKGNERHTGCTDAAGQIAVDADRDPAAIAESIVHERQHNATDRGKRTERCASFRGWDFVASMSGQDRRDAARSDPLAPSRPLGTRNGCY